jgi:hypothetical protein
LLAAVAFFIVFQINEATDLDVNAWPVGQGLGPVPCAAISLSLSN